MSTVGAPVTGNDDVPPVSLDEIEQRIEKLCQTSEASEFPPLNSARQLKRERATEKSKHTKLMNKIARYIGERGSRSGLNVHRSSLADQLEECIVSHRRYIAAADYDQANDPDGENYILKIVSDTREMYTLIDQYIQSRSSHSRKSSSSATFSSVADQNRPDLTAPRMERSPILHPVHPMDLPLEAFGPTSENPTSDVGVSVSAIQPLGLQSSAPNRDTVDWTRVTLNSVQRQLAAEREAKQKLEFELIRINELKAQNDASVGRLARELQRADQLQKSLELKKAELDRETDQRREVFDILRSNVEMDRHAQRQAHDKIMKKLQEKMRRVEEMSQASRDAIEYTNRPKSTGAVPKQLKFQQQPEEYAPDDYEADTQSRAGRESCTRPHLPQSGNGATFLSVRSSWFSESDDNHGRSGRNSTREERSDRPHLPQSGSGATFSSGKPPLLSESDNSGGCAGRNQREVRTEQTKIDSPRWSFSPSRDSNCCPSNRTSVFRIPKIDLDPYDGNPKNWPTFIANFRDLVNNNDSLSDTQKMALLRKCLKPEIQDSLGDCLNDPALYEAALIELESTYGHPHIISRNYIRTIIHLPKLAQLTDYKALLSFSTTLRGAVSSLKNGGYVNELSAGSLLEILLDKLPEEIQSKWGEKIVKAHPQCLTLQDFMPWFHAKVKAQMVVKHAGSVNDQQPSSGGNKQQDRKQGRQAQSKPGQHQPPTVLATTVPPPEKPSEQKVQLKILKEVCCPLCTGHHGLADCSDFVNKSVSERASVIKEHGCCLRCLTRGHLSKDCAVTEKCGIDECKFRHHKLMHGAPRLFAKPNPASKKSNPASKKSNPAPAASQPGGEAPIVGTMTRPEELSVLLAVVPITVRNGDKHFDTFALLDSGSEASLILDHAAKKIGLDGPNQPTQLSTFHGQDPEIDARPAFFEISPRGSSYRFRTTNSLAVPQLNLARKKCNWPREKLEWSHLADLELPTINSALVTVLLGRDVRGAHSILEERLAPPDTTGPDATLTPFGWCVAGPVPTKVFRQTAAGPRVHHIRLDSTEDLRENIYKLWDTEAFGFLKTIHPNLSSEDQRAMEILENSIRHTGERQEIALMWKSEDAVLPNNYSAALRHVEQLSARFEKDLDYAAKYDVIIQEYKRLGFAEVVDQSDMGTPGRTWYMQHHGVISKNKPGKVRVVFNCSARYKNVSLNDVLPKDRIC